MSSIYEDDFTQSARTTRSQSHRSVQSRQKSYSHHKQQTNEATNRSIGLTSKQLKSKLIESVRNKGILDSMKSQLRNKLALEMNSNIEQTNNKNGLVTVNQKPRSNLALNTINCLLIDHLRSNEYDYTLSVFMPESGINLNEVYALTDILHVLKISTESKLYSELTNSSVIKSKGLLWHLVNYFCSHYVANEVGTQTEYDGVHNIAASLDMKIKRLDDIYSNKTGNFHEKLSFEEKITLYQKRLEEQSRQEYADKLAQFRESELAKIRFEEREKIRVENQAYRMDLEHTYQKRGEALRQREESVEELLKQKKEMEERELFVQRQALLDEVKQLREREAAFKQSTEACMQLNKVDTLKFDRLNEAIKAREDKLKRAEEDFEKRLHSERERIKIDLDRAYGHREFLLQSVENKNKQDAQHNDIERGQLERIKHEHQTQSLRISELELEIQKLTGESMVLRQENELIKEKLSRCMDYDFIKQENKMLRVKLEVSKEMIGEKSVSRMSGRRSQTTNYQANRDAVSFAGNSQASNYVPQRKRSVTFASETGGVNDVNRLPIINDEASEAGVDNDDNVFTDNDNVLTQVTEPQSYLEEGERLLSEAMEAREMKENLESHKVVNSELRDLYEMQIFEQRKLHDTISDVKKHVEFLYTGVMMQESMGGQRQVPAELTSVLDTSLGFIDSAKDRLNFLERESQQIEQSYRDYQHKVKSKYYPINDDQESEIKLVTYKKKQQQQASLDIDKFFESTLKATTNAKVMRADLENEMASYSNEKEARKQKLYSEQHVQSVEELIRSVPIIQKDRTVSSSQLENQAIRKQLLTDQEDLANLKQNFRSIMSPTHKTQAKQPATKMQPVVQRQQFQIDDEDESSTVTLNQRLSKKQQQQQEQQQQVRMENLENDETFNSEMTSKIETSIGTSKKTNNSAKQNFGLNDYVKMFNENDGEEVRKKPTDYDSPSETRQRRSGGNSPKKQARVKIEYSSSSTDLSDQSDAGNRNDKSASFNRAASEKNDESDDDDDFKW